jgi:hypothetical protein
MSRATQHPGQLIIDFSENTECLVSKETTRKSRIISLPKLREKEIKKKRLLRYIIEHEKSY